MSQAEAGKAADWPGTAISLIEAGKRDTIYGIRNLLRVAGAFRVLREKPLPVILGHPAVFEDRRIACAGAALIRQL